MIRPMSKSDVSIVVGLFTASCIIMVFCIYGILTAVWLAPKKSAKIEYLKDRVVMQRVQIDGLTATIQAQEKQYRLASRWSRFHEIFCSPDEKIRFDIIEEYMVKKKGLYKPLKEN